MGLILDSFEYTTEKDTVGSATAQVAFVAEKEGLARLSDAYTAGVIWRRYMQKSMQNWLDALPVNQLPTGRIILPVSKVRSAVIELMNISYMPDCPERQVLLDDICLLACEFSRLCASQCLRLRFDVLTTNKCPKFHIDHVASRLLCTYRGVGTEYSFLNDQNRPAEVFFAPNCSAFVLRGTKWPTVCPNKLVHRSPEINHENETRCLLALDPVDLGYADFI